LKNPPSHLSKLYKYAGLTIQQDLFWKMDNRCSPWANISNNPIAFFIFSRESVSIKTTFASPFFYLNRPEGLIRFSKSPPQSCLSSRARAQRSGARNRSRYFSTREINPKTQLQNPITITRTSTIFNSYSGLIKGNPLQFWNFSCSHYYQPAKERFVRSIIEV
jgi:hypothetical protein